VRQENVAGVTQTPVKWLRCDGHQFRKLVQAGLAWLEKHQQQVNALNVFPVPDGDTGTNMLLTMRSAYRRIQDSDDRHVGRVAQELSHGALMGARGNSGVILSQIWRGLARSLKDGETFSADELAVAFKEAADTAYKGVMRPVEGTILTVIREGALEAQDAVAKSKDLRFLLERVVERCQQALARTPDLLPILKQAGVVDSGGQGLIYILEGMLRYVYGQMHDLQAQRPAPSTPAQALAAPVHGLDYPYDVQFILMGKDLDVLKVRQTIDAMGDSTVVVGDEQTIKVHVHVKDPGGPLSYGISLGEITDVVVENMQMQMEAIVGGAPGGDIRDRQPASNNQQGPEAHQGTAGGRAYAGADQPQWVDDVATPPSLAPEEVAEPVIEVQPGQVAVIAVAPGNGLARIFRSLGAATVVDGGQTNNPSTEEIFQAIQDVPTDKIIILPNNKNIILAAESARDLSPKQVVVLPTRTVPQGIGAMLRLDPDGELDSTAAAMADAFGHVVSGEITRATRSVTLHGVTCEAGQYIGLLDGQLVASGSDLGALLAALLEKMDVNSRELLSIYAGEDVDPAELAAVGEQIEAKYPQLEVELLSGGQPHYYYILGAE
jgi:uncharacterized protein